MSFGGESAYLPFLFNHNDQSTFLTGPIAALDSGSFLTMPAANRPPTCGGALTTNCLRTADVGRWNDLYAVTLGMVDNVSIVGARDGGLAAPALRDGSHFRHVDALLPVPCRRHLAHALGSHAVVRPHLQLADPLTEKLDRIALITDLNTGEVLSAESYLRAKKDAAVQGQIYNPQIGVRRSTTRVATRSPIPTIRTWVRGWPWRGRLPTRTASSAVSPGALGGTRRLRHRLRSRQHDLRAPAGRLRHRLRPGAADSRPVVQRVGCGRGGLQPGRRRLESWPVGVSHRGRRSIPIPPFVGGTSPIVPAVLNGGTSFATDPHRKIGRNYVFDFTVQREMPGKMIMEVGYVGRLGRDLPQGVDLDASPYFFRDSASGQTFAQAYDATALALRSGDAAANLTAQPWFENQLPGLGAVACGAGFRCELHAVSRHLAGAWFQNNSGQHRVPDDEPEGAR